MLNAILLAVFAFSSEGGGGSLIDVNPGLIFWTVVTFLILLVILKKVAWKPILTALDQREAAIKEALEKADKANEEARKILEDNKANLLKAEEESKKVIAQSREYAEKLKNQILQEGKQQAKKMIDDAAEEIERKNKAAFDELKNKVVDIAILAAEKLIKENLNNETQRKIVNNYINEISKN